MIRKVDISMELIAKLSDLEGPLIASNYLDDESKHHEGTWGVLDQANRIRARCTKDDARLFSWALNNVSDLVDENRALREEIKRLRRSI